MVLILLGLMITQTEIKKLQETGTEIAIVIGGGNILGEYLEPVKEWIVFRLITWECWQQ